MILYVNGEDFSAGARAVNDFSFANDDYRYVAFGLKPHPDNLKASYGMHLSKMLKLALVCEAEAQSTNKRILETTYEYLDKIDAKQHTIVVIGWSAVKSSDIHEEIYQLHKHLSRKKIPHLFFNAVESMSNIPQDMRKKWKNNFVEPYTNSITSRDHLVWARFLFKQLTTNNINV